MGIEWVLPGWAGVGRSRAAPVQGSGHRQSVGRGGWGRGGGRETEMERQTEGERGKGLLQTHDTVLD